MAKAAVIREVNNIRDNLAPFNDKSSEYFKKCLDPTNWCNVAEGGKRAGKNVLQISGFGARLDQYDDGVIIVSGVTKFLAMANIMECNGYGLLAFFDGHIRQGWYFGHEAFFVKTARGSLILLPKGGGKSDDYKKLRGLTIRAWYATEINLHHPKFIEEMITRTDSYKDKCFFFDLNPMPPGHFFYRRHLDFWLEQQDKRTKEIAAFNALPSSEQQRLESEGLKPRNYGVNYQHFNILDNMSIDDETLELIFERYDRDSLFFKTDILGQRGASFGHIYTSFSTKKCVISLEQLKDYPIVHFSIGIDVGGTDATVATLLAYTSGFKECILLDGYYHKQGNAQNVMDHSIYVQQIVDRILDWCDLYQGLFGVQLYAESADKMFRSALQKELRRKNLEINVQPSWKGTILDRIRLNSSLIQMNRFFIVNRPYMQPWIEAYEGASWDEKAYNEGEWVRLDNGSVPIDCLDSLEYALNPYRERLV